MERRTLSETVDAFEGEDLGKRPPAPFWRDVEKQAVRLKRKVEKRRKPITERKSRQLELFAGEET